MSENNNNDNWSNRNWQDASKFGGGRNNNTGFGGFSGGGMFGGGGGQNDDNQGGFFGNNRGSGKIGGGWMQGRNSTFVIIIVLVIVIIYTFYTQISMNASITKSTIERVKIESTFDSRTDPVFTDDFGAVDDERAIRDAAKVFHDATGVIPYIYFTTSDDKTNDAELTTRADEFYKSNFTDEDHFVVMFDGLQGGYYMGISAGANAQKVMDAEATQIFKDYLTKFYESRQTENQTYMTNTLRYTAERVMSTLPYSKSMLIFGIIAIAVLLIAIIIAIKRKSDAVTKNSSQIEE